MYHLWQIISSHVAHAQCRLKILYMQEKNQNLLRNRILRLPGTANTLYNSMASLTRHIMYWNDKKTWFNMVPDVYQNISYHACACQMTVENFVTYMQYMKKIRKIQGFEWYHFHQNRTSIKRVAFFAPQFSIDCISLNTAPIETAIVALDSLYFSGL